MLQCRDSFARLFGAVFNGAAATTIRFPVMGKGPVIFTQSVVEFAECKAELYCTLKPKSGFLQDSVQQSDCILLAVQVRAEL